jgi:hypothetical protein
MRTDPPGRNNSDSTGRSRAGIAQAPRHAQRRIFDAPPYRRLSSDAPSTSRNTPHIRSSESRIAHLRHPRIDPNPAPLGRHKPGRNSASPLRTSHPLQTLISERRILPHHQLKRTEARMPPPAAAQTAPAIHPQGLEEQHGRTQEGARTSTSQDRRSRTPPPRRHAAAPASTRAVPLPGLLIHPHCLHLRAGAVAVMKSQSYL